MRRFAFLLLGILTATWLQFEFFPGHSYLEAESQTYLPVLERLDTPGYLSRDLVATHTDLTYTIYDEVTLFLHEAGRLKFRTALETQQLVCRIAALTGVLLLALSTGMSDLLALLIAAFVNFGAILYGPAIMLMDHEPVPRAFAFALILLAAGLLAKDVPLLAGLVGGIALIYDPAAAAPFWGVAVVAFAMDSRLRRLLRPALSIFAIFILLLGNLAQLQPGVVESTALFRKVAPPLVAVQQYRTPDVWVSLWATSDIWSYLAIYVCGLWAVMRSWQTLNRAMRWLLLALPLTGLIGVIVSYVALEWLRWQWVPQLQPTHALMYTVAFSSVACGIAGARAAAVRKKWEASLWFVVVFAVVANSRVLDLLRLNRAAHLLECLTCIGLALAVAITVAAVDRRRRYAALLLPVIACLLIPKLADSHAPRKINEQPILQLANWAEGNTWGSSMFLFPDAGRDLYPGTFRAAARRAVWVDWSSGALIDFSPVVAVEWWDRWEHTMEDSFSPQRLQSMLDLPIDYYVVKRSNQLDAVKPVFRNEEFLVYDAADLRRVMTPLTLATHAAGT